MKEGWVQLFPDPSPLRKDMAGPSPQTAGGQSAPRRHPELKADGGEGFHCGTRAREPFETSNPAAWPAIPIAGQAFFRSILRDADREGKPPALCGHAPFVEKCCFAAAPCPVLSSGENRLPVSRPPAPLIIRPRFLRAKEPDPIPDPVRDQFVERFLHSNR